MAGQSPQGEGDHGSRSTLESVGRLLVEYPTVDPDLIRTLLEASLGRTSEARVQHYRLVLAERDVRNILRRGHHEEAEATPHRPDHLNGTSTTSTNTTMR